MIHAQAFMPVHDRHIDVMPSANKNKPINPIPIMPTTTDRTLPHTLMCTFMPAYAPKSCRQMPLTAKSVRERAFYIRQPIFEIND